MKKLKIANAEYIDLTCLNPIATIKDINEICEKASYINCATVCIPSFYLKTMKKFYPQLKFCTVIDFPFGNKSTDEKIMEAITAIRNGADEIDMVMNLQAFASGYYCSMQKEINEVKKVISNRILKVIIETCYWNKETIQFITELIDKSDADFIKTSTGFGKYGATFEDVKVIKEAIKYGTKIKASGGIRTAKEVQEYIDLGCDRIGISQLPK